MKSFLFISEFCRSAGGQTWIAMRSPGAVLFRYTIKPPTDILDMETLS
jgi:hypothetical protein